jgi:hypothetical protein
LLFYEELSHREVRVLTAVNLEITVFWDMMPRTLADLYGGTRCLHLRVRYIDNNLAENTARQHRGQ